MTAKESKVKTEGTTTEDASAGDEAQVDSSTTESNVVVIIGKCGIKLSGSTQLLAPGAEIAVSDSELNKQAWKHLFVSKNVEFKDDPKRTREYIGSVKVKEKVQPSTGEGDAK